MLIKKSRRTSIAILCLISFNIFVFQFFSVANATELSEIRSANNAGKQYTNLLNPVTPEGAFNIGDQENNKLSHPVRELSEAQVGKPGSKENSRLQSSINWNSKLQPYIDAHRKFWFS